MKFSELWLREWVNPALDSKALLNQITMAGFKVNSVEPVAGRFYGVLVGEVVKCEQHPNSDNLLGVKVNIGGTRLLDIVCGASNCRQGLKVAVATVGAVLPGDLKIKTTKLRGKLSEGMLCSYSELGIYGEHHGIIELPANAPIGTNIREYLKLDDNTIEISVIPNRADCFSIIGIARDIAVLNKTELNVPDIAVVAATISDTMPIHIEASDVCPRYLSRVVKGINAKVSTPIWMKEKLRRCGIRSIDVIVDITNYVLLELGQLVYVFDMDFINGGIVVRMAKEHETPVLPNGSQVKLNSNTLVIADHNKALAMAGILVNEDGGTNCETQSVLLGCGFFKSLSITSRDLYHSSTTNALYQYERSIDPEMQHKAVERATHLLIDICGGEAGQIIDVTNESMLPERITITLRRSKLNRLIGYHIDDAQVSDILRRLGCNVTEGQDQWQVMVPSWRFDMEIEEDLVEEVARVYGYNNIPDEPVKAHLIMGSHREADLSLKRVKMLLNDKGYQEVITYSFVDPKMQQLIHPGEEALVLPSPISSKMSVMRLSLCTGLLRTIIYNQNRQQRRVRIFETGLCFVPDTHASMGIRQDVMLAGAICGNNYEEHWNLPKRGVDFYDLKGDLESILDLTGKLSEIKFCAEPIPALHPGQSALIYLKGKRIGFIGALHPELEFKMGLNGPIMLFELEWNKISDRLVPKAQDVSRFPANRRDIAVVVTKNIPVADILAECKKVDVNQVVGVNLFDVYCGKGVKEGFKSLSISLILQDTGRTLGEKEIATTVSKCVEALKERFQASLRK